MRESAAYHALTERINTACLPQAEGQTVALIVFNEDSSPTTGVAVFHASFSVRAEVGAQPVTVCDETGRIVPSAIAHETLGEVREDGRRLWTLELRFLVADVPASGWRAYVASYAVPPPISDAEARRLEASPAPDLLVVETGLHPGNLPTTGSL